MSKFNQTNTNKTVNRCGHVAYKMEDELKLATMVLTSMFGEPKFYGDNTTELVQLANRTNPEFVSQLAIYARREMNLRSVSHALTAIVAHTGRAYTRKTVEGVVVRADDITEILACYIGMYGKPIPNALKRALGNAMKQFNDYQFAKYNGGNKTVKFRDVLRICHPCPSSADENDLFRNILNDTLPTPYTWETELSEKGNTREVWEQLIDSGKVGYMALLRNLRNIINSGARNVDKVYQTLSDPEQVHKSKQLPFRFYSAYKMLEQEGKCSTRVLDTLEDAIQASTDNLTKIGGKTLIAIDVSGSMGRAISAKSTVSCREVASVVASVANKLCEDAVIVTFDTSLKHKTVSSRNGILANARTFQTNGGGTDLTLPFKWMLREKQEFDRVILLSDNEINSVWRGGYQRTCQSVVDAYRKEVNPDLWVHAIDMQGYGTQQFIGKNTNIIAGWSEKVLEFIPMVENGLGRFVNTIMEYKL